MDCRISLSLSRFIRRGSAKHLARCQRSFDPNLASSYSANSAYERIQAELADVEAQLAATMPSAPIGKVATAKNPRAVWESLTVPQRRKVIDTIMEVRIFPPGRGVRTFDPDTVVCR